MLLLLAAILVYLHHGKSANIHWHLILTNSLLSSRLALHAINSLSNELILEAASRHEANQMFVDAFMTDRVQRL